MIKFWGTFLCLSAVVCSARIITFTATSTQSEAEADKQALAGIAIQIRANVSSQHQTVKSETKSSESAAKLQTDYSESISVSSDMTLKSVELKHEKSEQGVWKTTARLDTEKATADIRQKLFQIQQKAKTLDSIESESLKQNQLAKAIRTFNELTSLQHSHQRLCEDLAVFDIPGKDFQFSADLSRRESQITEAVSHLKLILLENPPAQSSDGSWGPIRFSVQGKTPLEGIEVSAVQNQKKLTVQQSDSSGTVQFFLNDLDNSRGTHSVFFRIQLPPFNGKISTPEISLSYNSEPKTCLYDFQCQGETFACTEIEKILFQAGFESGGKNPLEIKMTPSEKKVFDRASKKIFSQSVSVEIRGKNIHYSKTTKGTGSSEATAFANAIRKISPSEIQTALEPLCSEK